jgi:hypothetical protein
MSDPKSPLLTSDQIQAGLHHVYTAVGTASAVLIFVGLSRSDSNALNTAVHQIGDGVASIAAGVATLIPIATTLYAMWNNSPFSKMMNLKKNDQIQQVIAKAGTPLAAIADAIPGDKITSAPKAS